MSTVDTANGSIAKFENNRDVLEELADSDLSCNELAEAFLQVIDE